MKGCFQPLSFTTTLLHACPTNVSGVPPKKWWFSTGNLWLSGSPPSKFARDSSESPQHLDGSWLWDVHSHSNIDWLRSHMPKTWRFSQQNCDFQEQHITWIGTLCFWEETVEHLVVFQLKVISSSGGIPECTAMHGQPLIHVVTTRI